MSFEPVRQSKPQAPQTSWNISQFAPRSFSVQEPERPPTQEELENQAFQQDKFEVTGLQLKEKSGTITPVEQEKLGMLQAKMDSFWAQRMEQAKAQPNLLEVLIRNAQVKQTTQPAAPVQPKLTIGEPNDQYEQEADQVAEQVMKMSAPPEDTQPKPNQNTVQRKPVTPSPQQPHGFAHLDLFSHAPQRRPLTNPFQAKLTIGQPNDVYEQEADRVAEQVMRMAPPTPPNVQRQPEDEQSKGIQPKSWAEIITPIVQRQEDATDADPLQPKCETCEQEEQVQRSADGIVQAQPDLESRLNASKCGGSPLPDEVRSFMEPRFRADFSQVQVHTGSEAVQMNQELGAQAFTHRNHIYYGAGKAPAKDELTGHELTHVVQQTGANQIQRLCGVDESCPEEAPTTATETPTTEMTSAEAPVSISTPNPSMGEAADAETGSQTEGNEFDALVQAELESFLAQFSAITVTVRWVEQTDIQSIQHEEPVVVHPPYFMNVTGQSRSEAAPETITRYDTAMSNRGSADRATRDYLGAVRRSQDRGGMGMGRALQGKSRPEDIQTILQNAIDRHLIQPARGQTRLNSQDLRNWLVHHGIGVDCSAFVSQALNRVMEQVYGRPLTDEESISLGSGGLRGGARGFSRVEAADLRTGDTMGISGHIRIVTNVRHDEDGNVVFTTAESRAGGAASVGPDRAEWRYQGSQLQIRRSSEEAWTNSDETPVFGRYDRLTQAEAAQVPVSQGERETPTIQPKADTSRGQASSDSVQISSEKHFQNQFSTQQERASIEKIQDFGVSAKDTIHLTISESRPIVQRLDSRDVVGNTLSATDAGRRDPQTQRLVYELDARSQRLVYERIADLEGRNPIAAGAEFGGMTSVERADALRSAISRFQASEQGRSLIRQISEDNAVTRADGSMFYDPPETGRRSEETAPRAGYAEASGITEDNMPLRSNDITMQALANAWPQTIFGRRMEKAQAYEVLRKMVIRRGLPFNESAINVVGVRAYQGGAIHDNGEEGARSRSRRPFTDRNRYDDTTYILSKLEGTPEVIQSRATVDPGAGPGNPAGGGLKFSVAADQQWDYSGNARRASQKFDRPMYGLPEPMEVRRGRYWTEHPEELGAARPRGGRGRLTHSEDGRIEFDRTADGTTRSLSALHSGGGGGATGEKTFADSTGCTVIHGAWFAHFNESLRRASGGDSVRFTYSLIDPRTYTPQEIQQIVDSVVPPLTQETTPPEGETVRLEEEEESSDETPSEPTIRPKLLAEADSEEFTEIQESGSADFERQRVEITSRTNQTNSELYIQRQEGHTIGSLSSETERNLYSDQQRQIPYEYIPPEADNAPDGLAYADLLTLFRLYTIPHNSREIVSAGPSRYSARWIYSTEGAGWIRHFIRLKLHEAVQRGLPQGRWIAEMELLAQPTDRILQLELMVNEAYEEASWQAETQIIIDPTWPEWKKQYARLWNEKGQLFTDLAHRIDPDIQPHVAAGIMAAESGQTFFREGRPISRFEAHVFWNRWGKTTPVRTALFNQHFIKTNPHQWRRYAEDSFQPYHNNQDLEWEVIDFARTLDSLAEIKAIESASFGAGQTMGFNYARAGFSSPLELYLHYQASEQAQISGIFNFIDTIRPLSRKTAVINGIKTGNFLPLSEAYGPQNPQAHSQRIADAVARMQTLIQNHAATADP